MRREILASVTIEFFYSCLSLKLLIEMILFALLPVGMYFCILLLTLGRF